MEDTPSATKTTAARDTDIYYSYVEGQTLAEIGERHGITRERARPLLNKQGVTRRSTTESATVRNRAAREKYADYIHACYRKYGNIADTVKHCADKVPASVVKSVIADMTPAERNAHRNRPLKERTYDDAAMRTALARATDAGATTITAYREWRDTPAGEGSPPTALLIMRYGSWRQARAAAGLESSSTTGRRRTFTDAEIYGAVNRFVVACESNGLYPSANQYETWSKAVGGVPTLSTVRQRTNSTWLETVATARSINK